MNAKLEPADVLEILRSAETGAALARRFRVNQSVISRIRNKKDRRARRAGG